MLPLDLPKLTIPKLGLPAWRSRLIFRGIFLLLIIATLALALVVLQEEKQRSHQSYIHSFGKTQAEIIAKLRHPAGQLALLNPGRTGEHLVPLQPMLLPYAAIDFDDQNKAQQAAEMAGCLIQYPQRGAVCAGIGNNPYAGGYIYLIGNFISGDLVARTPGTLELQGVHRARITLTMRGETMQWIAPFESLSKPADASSHGRLTGFVDYGDTLLPTATPVRDFRGWLWQGRACEEKTDCARPAFFSIRLPVEAYRDALFQKSKPTWPPRDLDQTTVRIEILAPGVEQPIFDSNAADAIAPFALNDVRQVLQAGESVQIHKIGTRAPHADLILKGTDDTGGTTSPLIMKLIQHLPADGYDKPLQVRDTLHTSGGSYEITLSGETRGLDRALSAVATRVSWFVAAMLGAIVLAWLLIEISFIRRVAVLTKRAATVAYNVQDDKIEQRITHLDLSDLRGSDEVGILANSLADLLQRVKDDVQREHIRAQQERDLWHAVGHEIMSPLQSLMVLHPTPEDPSHRYIQRMQQAVRVLYGSASPSEALEAATLQLAPLDLNEFLTHVASNAHFAGLHDVEFTPYPAPVMVRADAFSLEDVVTHILKNADRFRVANTTIHISLSVQDNLAEVRISNQGPSIDPALIDKIFEYGVSGSPSSGEPFEHRGQGLFVSKTYMAKMGGRISVMNTPDGVCFSLELQQSMS